MADLTSSKLSEAYALAYDGHYVGSLEAHLQSDYLRAQDNLLRELKSLERRCAEGIREIEGKGRFWSGNLILSHTQTLAERIHQVSTLADAVQQARTTVEVAEKDTSARAAKGVLGEAADAIESRDPALAKLIRETAQFHADAERIERDAERAKAQIEREAKEAKKLARPLGKVEGELLKEAAENPTGRVARSWSSRKNKAIDSLIARGLFESTGTARSGQQFQITRAGKELVAAGKAVA